MEGSRGRTWPEVANSAIVAAFLLGVLKLVADLVVALHG